MQCYSPGLPQGLNRVVGLVLSEVVVQSRVTLIATSVSDLLSGMSV